jgi:hypothetical protein
MTMKRFGVAALLLSAMALTTTGCGMMKGGDDNMTKMSAEEHKEKNPKGHVKSPGSRCYYDRYNDTFLCNYK